MNFFKSKKVQAILLILAAIFTEFISAVIYRNINNTIPFPEILYYSSQIVTSIFVISGVVIAVWQYYLSSKSSKTDLEIVQVQRAIDLSEYYKDNILRYYPAIYYIFSHTGITDILDTIKPEQMKEFDSQELNHIFTPAQINRLKELQKTDEFVKSVIEANDIYNLHLKIHGSKREIEREGSIEITIAIDKFSVAIAFTSNLINDVLNNMEFFALHFKHHTADESVIYQSLHQSYFEIILYMYYYIAKNNTDPTNKFYTNVIWLFNKWRETKNKQNSERCEKSRSIPYNGTIIENNY